ncbi:MAG: hypothetical protein R6W78_13295 [Bacteroidales bacterium]
MKSKGYQTILKIMLISLLFSCEDNNPMSQNEGLIFTYASAIDVPGYTYLSGTDTITVHGEAGIVDTLTPMPVLQWDSISIPYLVAAIFSQPVEVENGVIFNTSDIIWFWHSGLESGKNGYVEFGEGKQMINGDINNLLPPVALAGTARYYWGIWGWDYSGTRVKYSSKPFTFYVK